MRYHDHRLTGVSAPLLVPVPQQIVRLSQAPRIGAVLVMLVIVAVFTVSCSSGVTIRDARTTPMLLVPGTTPAFGSYLSDTVDQAIVVLVHGVGIHCPAYGLNAKSGWLNDKTAAGLNLVPLSAAPPHPEYIADGDNRVAGVVDPKSGLYLTRREFIFKRPQKADAHVLVAEITWSGLTAWIKDNQLAYDLSNDVPAGAPPAVSCPAINDATNAFHRQALNKVIKEKTLDLALSDAMLYVGTYGAKIERGVAEALCRITSTRRYNERERCDWTIAEPSALQARFLFMTHSLGSRIVYDTLLDLAGTNSRGATSAFSPEYRSVAQPATDKIVENTKAIYMFANQLPLLGLSNVPVTLRSDDGPAPVLEAQILGNEQGPPDGHSAGASMSNVSPVACVMNPIVCFANLRALSAGPQAKALGPLDIVAFSDPNDLLSYAIPPWYVRDVGDLRLHITNVYVQNSTHWLGLIENPISAHEDYVLKASPVWRVVRCGAKAGSIVCER